jgi:hypothetical protein
VADAWMPGARRIRAETDGGQLGGGAPRVVWLTLGADPRAISVWSAAQRLNQEYRSPHLVWDPLTGDIAQLLPIVRAGCALGTPEDLEYAPEKLPYHQAGVNCEGRLCVQIGVLGSAKDPFTGYQMIGLGEILVAGERVLGRAEYGDLDAQSSFTAHARLAVRQLVRRVLQVLGSAQRTAGPDDRQQLRDVTGQRIPHQVRRPVLLVEPLRGRPGRNDPGVSPQGQPDDPRLASHQLSPVGLCPYAPRAPHPRVCHGGPPQRSSGLDLLGPSTYLRQRRRLVQGLRR